MPVDPDQPPAPDPAPETDPAPDDAGKPVADSSDPARGEDPRPVASEGRLAAIYRQWRTPGRPSGDVHVLVRTTPEDPDGLPFLDLLGVEPPAVEDAWAVWDGAQLASDATALGRALRPLVSLVPAGGRWFVARSMGHTSLLEPIDHATPSAALHAAEVRYGLIAARRVGHVLDELGVAVPDEDEQAARTEPETREPAVGATDGEQNDEEPS